MFTKPLQRMLTLCLLLSLLVGTTWIAYANSQGAVFAATVTKTFTPVADSYVVQSSPSSNYGTSHSLRADASPVTRSYLRFSVTGLNGDTVQSATLRLYAGSSSSIGVTVQALSDNTWTETGLT